MIKLFKKNKGATLLEIIISMAILGIILTALINVFSFGSINIIHSGQKSEKLMDLQSIVDSLNSQDNLDDKNDIVSYLKDTKGYKEASSLSNLTNKDSNDLIKFYVSNEETKYQSKGHTVSLVSFINEDGSRYSRLSTFVITGGI